MDEVTQYYQQRTQIEWNRLDRYRMEFDMTKKLLLQYIKNPLEICDVGGGPGKYSLYLAKQKHRVTLVDLCEENIQFAQLFAIKESVNIENFIVANATEMSCLKDNSYDLVLLMGPLYHLVEKQDRIKAVKECHRILKPGGIIFASFVSRFERLRFLAEHEPSYLAHHQNEIMVLVEYGIMHGSMILSNNQKSFTTAYFAHPNEITEFMNECEFQLLSLHGLEVITGKPFDKINSIASDIWDAWVDLSLKLSTEPSLLGAADHIIYIGKK
jgi:S-adenosylmethionine-dependent methyltransferase